MSSYARMFLACYLVKITLHLHCWPRHGFWIVVTWSGVGKATGDVWLELTLYSIYICDTDPLSIDRSKWKTSHLDSRNLEYFSGSYWLLPKKKRKEKKRKEKEKIPRERGKSEKKEERSMSWFRSRVLRVMSPAIFRWSNMLSDDQKDRK